MSWLLVQVTVCQRDASVSVVKKCPLWSFRPALPGGHTSKAWAGLSPTWPRPPVTGRAAQLGAPPPAPDSGIRLSGAAPQPSTRKWDERASGEARGHFVPISLVSTQAGMPSRSTRAARLTCVPPLLGPCGAPVGVALLGPSAPSALGAQTFDGPVTGTCREVEAREDGEPPLPTPVAVRSKPRC